MSLTPRQHRVWRVWQSVGVGGLVLIGALMVISARKGIDPATWAPFVFGAVAIAFGTILAGFPTEFDGILEHRMRAYGYAGGFPVRGVGIGFILVGGSMVLQAAMR